MSHNVVPQRDARGYWLPGRSANPGGRTKDSFAIQELAKSYAPQAVKTLAALMVDKRVPAQVRVNAAQALLDRGYGRPAQSIEAKVETVDLGAMHLAALQALAGQNGKQGPATPAVTICATPVVTNRDR
jgi:hypothetical protein